MTFTPNVRNGVSAQNSVTSPHIEELNMYDYQVIQTEIDYRATRFQQEATKDRLAQSAATRPTERWRFAIWWKGVVRPRRTAHPETAK
jgi:hypothetical protein